MNEPTTYSLRYSHNHGTDVLLFKSYESYGGWYGIGSDEEPPVEVLTALGLLAPFEPEIGEVMEITTLASTTIPLVGATPPTV